MGIAYVVDRKIADLLAAVDENLPETHVCESAVTFAGADILVAFGGDGTILAAAREVGDRGISDSGGQPRKARISRGGDSGGVTDGHP